MTDKIKPLQQASEAQPEPADFDTWLKEQFEYKNWYYKEGGSGDMSVPFARKAWNAGFAKGVLEQQHVGDSRFEGWYGNEFDAKHKGTKQQMREAYEAGMKNTIAAPRPAPTQQPAKPVSWHREPSDLTSCLQKLIDALYDNSDPVSVDAAEFLEKLYTPPPAHQPRPFRECEGSQAGQPQPAPQQEEEECEHGMPLRIGCDDCTIARLVDENKALKAAQPAEPIGVVATNPDLNTVGSAYVVKVLVDTYDAVRVGDKLYTSPPPEQQPLTKAQIKALIVATPEPDDGDVGKWVLSLIRAVEKAHKIGSRP